MQMSDDGEGPANKRLKTETSYDIDLSALSELPDSLLTSHTSPQNRVAAASSNASYLSNLLTSAKSPPMRNGGLIPSSYQMQGAEPSVVNVFASQQQPVSSTMQQTISATISNSPSQLQQRQPLVSAVRPQMRVQTQQKLPHTPTVQGTAQTSPSGLTQASITSDPQRRKLITQQLVLLLHAHKCTKRNMTSPEDLQNDPDVCRLHHCKIMKNTLQHMQNCQNGRQCQESHCVSSRQIIAHWRNCQNPSCQVCLPLRTVSRKARLQQNGLQGLSATAFPSSLGNMAVNNGSIGGNVTGSLMDSKGMGSAVGPSLIRTTNSNGLGSLTQHANPQQPSANMQLTMPQQLNHIQRPSSLQQPTLQPHMTTQLSSSQMTNPHVNAQQMTQMVSSPQLVNQMANSQQMTNQMSNSQQMTNQLTGSQQLANQIASSQPISNQMQNSQLISNQMASTQQVNQPLTSPQQLSNQLANSQQLSNQLTGPQQLTNQQLASPIANRVIQAGQPNMLQAQSSSTNLNSLLSPTSSSLMAQQANVAEPGPINVEDMKEAYSALGLRFNPNGKAIGQFLQQPLQQQGSNAAQSTMRKEWQVTVDVRLRKYLIDKLVLAIFPKPDPMVVNDPRMHNLLSYAKKVEGEMFRLANSREEYYQRLAEKIYKIRQELKEKRKQRQVQEMQKQAARAMLSSSEDPMLVSTKPDPLNIKLEPAYPLPSAGASSPTANNQSFSVTRNLLKLPSVKVPKKEPEVFDVKPAISNLAASATNEATPTPSTPTPTGEHKKVVAKKVWSCSELKLHLMPLVTKMTVQDDSIFLRVPVDPAALNIPDYFDIIKKPMDLSTIRNKLDDGIYKCPWDFVNDVWLMFENAWMYNKKSSKVHKVCTKLSEMFESEINVLMKKLGYCCGKKYVFYPNVLVCYGKQSLTCTIAQYQAYYVYENRYTFCDKCFADITTDEVELTDELTGQPLVVPREKFELTKNDVLDPEEMTTCKDCERMFHSICVQYLEAICDTGYLCDACLKVRNQKRKENKFTARRLPICKLSTHIEERVNAYLSKKNIGGEVLIRILSNTEKESELKQGMRERYPEMAFVMPFKCKAIFAFQYCKEQNRELCFFAMQVQEYDSSCPAPNTGRVYISYLDSVHFFTPRDYRTAVYHEILIGYFDHVRILGYKWGHIWACPPSEGDNYIFHAHPTEQKVPKPKRLQDWYKKMLDKSIIEGVVQDYKDIYKDVIEKGTTQPYELPYFDGDFWTTVLEECIKECQDEEEAAVAAEADVDVEVDVAASALEAAMAANEPHDPITSSIVKAKKPKGNKNKNLKKNAGKRGAQGFTDLQSRFLSNLEKQREMFFVIRLKNEPYTTGNELTQENKIVDPDPLVSSDLMDARDSFLTMCREKHWEFSSLRRAAYSTMAFLHEIHTTSKDGFVYTCNSCKNQVETRFHCVTCDDYDLCVPCYNKLGHDHRMEKLGLDIEGGESVDSKLSPDEARKLSLQRCIDSLQHASQCKDANCKQSVCEKMKRVVSHTKMCKRKTTGGCPICKQLIALCCYHAKICKEAMCSVPFCSNIKSRLELQKANQRIQGERQLKRRVAQQLGGIGMTVTPATRIVGQGIAAHNTIARSASQSVQPYSTAATSLLAQAPQVAGSYPRAASQLSQPLHQRLNVQQRVVLTNQQRVQQMQPHNQSQQLMHPLQRQQPMGDSVLPQPIILNQGTQNVQVVHPQKRQQPQAESQPQLMQPQMPQTTATAQSEEAKHATKIKVQQIIAALKNGNRTPEEKQKLIMLLKKNPALMQMFQRQKKAAAPGLSPHTVPSTSLLTRVPSQSPSASSLMQQQLLSPHNSGPSDSAFISSHDTDPNAQEELSRFVDNL
ncbi:histone acetyltransferase p300-like [Watersipora subatra]|uniref:histone acetyltransferase p300-like n=1 Tax=Watersipora subatra TaxID=2589382 RepID=UPI00355C91CB